MPNLQGLDLSRNALRCDEDLSAAVQWLTDNNVTPSESMRAMGSIRRDLDYDGASPSEANANDGGASVSQWTDLAKKLCDSWEGGPPTRPAPKKPTKKPGQSAGAQATDAAQESAEAALPSLPGPFIKFDFSDDSSYNGNKVS